MINRIKEDVSYYWAKTQFLTARVLGIHPELLSRLILALIYATMLMGIGILFSQPMGTKTLVVIGSIVYSTMIASFVYKQSWSFPLAIMYTGFMLFIPIPNTIKLVLIVSAMIVLIPFARAMERALAIHKCAVLNPLYERRELKSWEQMMVKVNEDRYRVGVWLVILFALALAIMLTDGKTNLLFSNLAALGIIFAIQTYQAICKQSVYSLLHGITHAIALLLFVGYIIYSSNYILIALVLTFDVSLILTLASLHSKSKVVS